MRALEAKASNSEKECQDQCKKTSDFVDKLFRATMGSTQKADVPPKS